MELGTILAIAIPVGLIVIIGIILLATGYVKAPPDQAIIISGIRKTPKILIGRSGVKLPYFERKDTLILKQISVDIKTNGYIPTLDFIGVNVDAIAKIKVKTDEEGMATAMKNFLNMSEQQIIHALTDSLQGNMREIIGTIPLQAICNERKQFGDQVQEKAQKDMNALGIEIISCNIQKAEDENGLINSLGQENMSQIQKSAAIAKAAAERDIAIAKAEAKQKANEAEVAAETQIAQNNNELEIKKSELKSKADVKKAQADAAYGIQKEEQRKTIEVTAAAADIAKQEKAIELKEREAAVKEQELAATVKKEADARKYADQQAADADFYKREQEAKARTVEAQQEAIALKAKADAEMYAKTKEAEGIAAVGEAEAKAIKAKGIAEAEGIEKKAEAMKKMGEASVLEMFFNAYPSVMEAAAKPLANVDQITMFGEGNSAKFVGDVVGSTRQVIDGIKAGTGLDVAAILSGFLGGKMTGKALEKSEMPGEISSNE